MEENGMNELKDFGKNVFDFAKGHIPEIALVAIGFALGKATKRTVVFKDSKFYSNTATKVKVPRKSK